MTSTNTPQKKTKMARCSSCHVVADFTFEGDQENGQGSHKELWTCGNCGTTLMPGSLAPVAPAVRVVRARL